MPAACLSMQCGSCEAIQGHVLSSADGLVGQACWVLPERLQHQQPSSGLDPLLGFGVLSGDLGRPEVIYSTSTKSFILLCTFIREKDAVLAH